MERSIVLIDAENVLKGWQNFCSENNIRAKIDYKKLINVLSDKTNLLRAYFYDGVTDPIQAKKKKFLETLQEHGIQLRTRVLKCRNHICGYCSKQNSRWVQKGVDVALATDILRHAWQQTCEICIIVSGDEDYKDAIDVARDKGIKVWIASFRKSLARELRNNADKVLFIENFIEQICLENETKKI